MKTAICAIAKNENHYVAEWCDYHLKLGFDKIFIFDNNDIDGERIKTVINNSNVIIDERFIGKNDKLYQNDAYTLFYKTHKEFDWIAFIDIDEFIYLDNNKKIKDFLSDKIFNNVDAIRLCWKCYTDNNLIKVSDNDYSVKRFTKFTEKYSTQAKTIIRGNLPHINHVYIHTSPDLKNAVDANGNKCWNGPKPNESVNIGKTKVWNNAYIKHYRFKTLEEFIDIKMRNWQQKHIKNKWIDIKYFFDINDITADKLEYIKSKNINMDGIYDIIKTRISNIGEKRNIHIDIDNPITIQDKINWLKCYDIIPLKTECSDKLAVHKYCEKILGKDICVPVLKIYDSPDDIDLSELPEKFVLKCNHGWNMNIIKNNDRFDLESVKTLLKNWLSVNFGESSGEYQYSGIQPKCYAEKFLNDNENGLTDYKFWCFNGIPKIFNIYCNHGNNYYDLNFNLLPINNLLVPCDITKKYEKPKNFDTMIKYSELLSKEFKFVRIDFYEVNDTVYLGEMTFTPGNGFMKHDNENTDLLLGNMLKL